MNNKTFHIQSLDGTLTKVRVHRLSLPRQKAGNGAILMTRLSDGEKHSRALEWRERELFTAHLYLETCFESPANNSIIDAGKLSRGWK